MATASAAAEALLEENKALFRKVKWKVWNDDLVLTHFRGEYCCPVTYLQAALSDEAPFRYQDYDMAGDAMGVNRKVAGVLAKAADTRRARLRPKLLQVLGVDKPV